MTHQTGLDGLQAFVRKDHIQSDVQYVIAINFHRRNGPLASEFDKSTLSSSARSGSYLNVS